jgi:hypothetical protein
MRSFALLLLLLAFCSSLPSCAQKASPTKTTAKVKAKKTSKKAAEPAKTEAGPVITFERTACFGTCPAYSMQVFADGRVLYEGRRWAPFVGKKELRMTPAALADLRKRAAEAHFEQFDERYTRHTTDLPGTLIGVQQPTGTMKVVWVEEGAPENVQELFTYFGHQFDALAQAQAASDK